MSEAETNRIEKKFIFIVRIILLTVFYFIVDEYLTRLNDETLVQNWEFGLFWMMFFIFFYCVDRIKIFIFKMNLFHAIMIEFWLTWILADISDFISDFLSALDASLKLFGLV